jgi:hypothetical protein
MWSFLAETESRLIRLAFLACHNTRGHYGQCGSVILAEPLWAFHRNLPSLGLCGHCFGEVAEATSRSTQE